MEPITVSALSTTFDIDRERRSPPRCVGDRRGEQLEAPSSGHIYFSLKDGGATIGAVMWRNAAEAQNWLPRDAIRSWRTDMSACTRTRAYQIYVNLLRPRGAANCMPSLEALKDGWSRRALCR